MKCRYKYTERAYNSCDTRPLHMVLLPNDIKYNIVDLETVPTVTHDHLSTPTVFFFIVSNMKIEEFISADYQERRTQGDITYGLTELMKLLARHFQELF